MLEVVGPLPEAGSLPFRSARNRSSSLHVDLAALGYVEEEFFLTGRADVCGIDGEVVEPDAPFTTRLLVRRPHRDFSGTVVLEPFHVLAEDTPSWTSGYRHHVFGRDAWVGVTVNAGQASPGGMPGGVPMLKESDPQRYDRLDLRALPAPALETRPSDPIPFDPEAMRRRLTAATPQGHAIVAQAAAALRDPGSGLLGREAATVVYASGWSQTGLFWRNYLDHGHHDRAGAAHGRSPVDAYLINVAPAPERRPADAVVWHVLSESEVVGTLNPPMVAVEDSDDGPRARGYEVPGSFHYWHLSRRMASVPVRPDHPDPHNDRPWYLVTHALLARLDAWVRDGVTPPRAPRIARDTTADDGVARDEVGNACGGLRTPWVDVPDARYLPRCTCNPAVGAMQPFTEEALIHRHGSRAEHRRRFSTRAEELAADGWLLERDLEVIGS